MKHIGIVACSAEGAALCYRTVCSVGARRLGGHVHPEISMHTPSFQLYVDRLDTSDWLGVAELMTASAQRLRNIGADFLICPDNTIHQALPMVISRTPLPWLHIADSVGSAALKRGFRRIGIMGTRWLVDSEVYPEKFDAVGLEYLRPDDADRDEVHRIIMDELVHGEFKAPSIEALRAVTNRLKDAGCDSVVLGCTELPLVLDDASSAVPVLDSTRLLAAAAVQRAIDA